MPKLSTLPQAKMTRAQVRSVPCPDCGVNANEKCVGAGGKPRTSSHAARWGAYREASTPKPLTILQIVGIVRKYEELEREIEAAKRAIQHGGNEDTMRFKHEALERAERELKEFAKDPAHVVDPWWM